MNLHNVEFIKSAANPKDFISDYLPQIVFSGKSNVGKSSVINKLLNRKNFARVGSEPGKTVHINYFRIDKRAYFVDLPGYGFAKVSKEERDRWGILMEKYFAGSVNMALGIVILDIRHKPTQDDYTMLEWFRQSGKPYIIIANKADKLSKTAADKNLAMIRDCIHVPDDVELFKFSANTGENCNRLLSRIMTAVGE